MKYLSLLILLTIIGCSTIDSIPNNNNYPGYEKKVYAGTRNDLSGIPYIFTEEAAWGVIALAELPFCLVADTLIFPYTFHLDQQDNNIDNTKIEKE